MRLGAMPLSDRIRKIRISKALNQAEFGEALGVSQGTVSRWEKARGAQVPDKDALKNIARLAGISVDDLISDTDLVWANTAKVKLSGFIGDGAVVYFSPGGETSEFVESFLGAEDGVSALEVRGECLGENFDGWLAYFEESKVEITSDMIGQLCVVWLEDGRVLTRKITTGQINGAYTLRANFGPPIYDARILSAARVIHMKPRA